MEACDAEACTMPGLCTRRLGNPKGALGYDEKALSLKPGFPDALAYDGEAWLQLSNLPRAVRQYTPLVKASSRNASEPLDAISAYANDNASG